jgi:hypothetical protein
VVPKEGRERVLVQLHEGHPGTAHIKSWSVWWPGITKQPYEGVPECQAVAPLHPWCWPTRPWARLHWAPTGRDVPRSNRCPFKVN